MSDEEVRLKLRIDTSQLADDLAAVDKQIDKIQRLMQAAYNRAPGVRKGRTGRALNFADVMEGREFWTPEVTRLEGMLRTRLRHIERAAQAGELEPPPTIKGRARVEAQQRLEQLRQQRAPIEITARQKFFDDMRTSLMRGLGSAPAMAAAQTGIPGASGLARALMGLVEANPYLAAGFGAAAGLGGGALAVSAMQADFQRQQAALAGALVGGPAFGQTRTLLGLGVMAAAQGVDTSQSEGQQIAQLLANANMTPGQVVGNLPNVLNLTKRYGQQTSDVEPLVAALGTAGGMSAADIKRTLQDVVAVSGKATGSIQMLVGGAKTLSTVNTQAARDIYGLAAAQRAVGATSGINAGQLLAPAMGAFGPQAFGLAGLLGLTPQRFAQLQQARGGMAQIFGLESRFMQRLPHDAMGQELGLQILSDAGGLDISKLTVDQKLQLARKMQQDPSAALAYYQSLSTKPPPRRPLPPTNVPPHERFLIAAQNKVTQTVATHSLGDLAYRAAELVTGNLGAAFGPAPWTRSLNPFDSGDRSSAAGEPSVRHDVNIKVTVQDQRGHELTRKVDHTRVLAGGKQHGHPPPGHPHAPR